MTRTSSPPAPYLPGAGLSETLADRAGLVDRYDTGFGLTGLSLYFLYRYRAHGRAADLRQASDLCLRAANGLCADPPRDSRTIECCELGGYLARNADVLGLTTVADQLLPVLDGLLERRMRAQLAGGDTDPYTGGFHPAWYFLTARGRTAAFTECWLAALPDAAQLREPGPDGHPRLATGISHGLAGYAVFLDRWLRSGASHLRLSALTHRARLYLTVLEERCDAAYTHGCYYRDGRSATTSRLSLAYGDAGILAAGWQLARTLGDRPAEARFLERLLRTATRRSPEETGITEASLLYGSAGMHLFFGYLDRRCPQPVFAAAARHWQTRARTQVQGFSPQELPASPPYDYPAMKQLSLFEGVHGARVAEWALATDLTDLTNLFYLP